MSFSNCSLTLFAYVILIPGFIKNACKAPSLFSFTQNLMHEVEQSCNIDLDRCYYHLAHFNLERDIADISHPIACIDTFYKLRNCIINELSENLELKNTAFKPKYILGETELDLEDVVDYPY